MKPVDKIIFPYDAWDCLVSVSESLKLRVVWIPIKGEIDNQVRSVFYEVKYGLIREELSETR